MLAQAKISQYAGITTARTNWHTVWLNGYTATANQAAQMTSLIFSVKGCRHHYSVSYQLVHVTGASQDPPRGAHLQS